MKTRALLEPKADGAHGAVPGSPGRQQAVPEAGVACREHALSVGMLSVGWSGGTRVWTWLPDGADSEFLLGKAKTAIHEVGGGVTVGFFTLGPRVPCNFSQKTSQVSPMVKALYT